MKKLIAIILSIIILITTIFMFTSCNQMILDTVYTFDYALIKFPDGEVKKIWIDKWTDYEDGDQLQIKSIDGTIYLVHSVNCVLVKEDD